MHWREIDTSSIPDSEYIREIDHLNGDTRDIMEVILKDDSEHDPRFCDFSRQFEPNKKSLKVLWAFVRHAIRYQEDPTGRQDIKLPSALWRKKVGDCKSKTLFVNQVLKCLGVNYQIKFVGYDGETIKHVYTIAHVEGRLLAIDTVYNYYGYEPEHNIQETYNMSNENIGTVISTIRGIDSPKVEDLYYSAQESALKRVEEIQQRKAYVSPQAPIEFNKLTTGEALYKSMIRKLNILGVMHDNPVMAEKGINLVRQVMRTGSAPTGVIPDELQGVAQRINNYRSMNMPATGHGIRGKALNMLKIRAKSNHNNIGALIDCTANLWFGQLGGSGTVIDPFQYQQLSNTPTSCSASSLNFFNNNGNNIYFFYGRNQDKYRTNFAESGNTYAQILNDVVAQYPNMQDFGYGAYDFGNQSVYDAVLEELKQRMPVLSKWVNELFKADSTKTDGTAGTGLYYSFIPQVTNFNASQFPTIVQTKMLFQQNYISSCVNFSSVADIIVMDLIENGFMFDMGGYDPLTALESQLVGYQNNQQIGLTGAEIAAIVVAVIKIAASIITTQLNKGAEDAKTIDDLKENSNQFNNQGPGTVPELDDFAPLPQSGGNNPGGNNNNDKDKKKGLNPLVVAVGTYLGWRGWKMMQ